VSDALVREAIRLYRRYQEEVVEAFDLCPWAARARRDGRVREHVALDTVADVDTTLAYVDALAADGTVDVGLVIYPRLAIDRIAFERFAGAVRDADQARGTVTMALAPFHPDAEADLSAAERLIPFLRRTPDPTLQCVRRSVLDRVRREDKRGSGFVDVERSDDVEAWLLAPDEPPLHERIARINRRTVSTLGPEQLEARFAAIRADRESSYAAAGS
jgi:hypothetical protein